ncbi:hypothetical protein [uncultured Megamonas sp.]|uniref:hypothetical protein n=1 Tax=uncultured Megamonas sp. TaxID=286140 RepID=UPI00266F7BE4|nr:hypothetical protein [uncultured Megamonas sp.]
MILKRMFLTFMSIFVLIAITAMPSTSFAADGYLYTSERFGYSIKCPEKPLAVINLSILSPQEQGDVLIFETDGHNPTKYWVVSPNAFSNDTFPDLDNLSEEAKQNLFTQLAVERGYEAISLVPIQGHNAIYAVTAKTIQIDTNKDGQVDETIKQDGQNIETYLKGVKSNYCIVLSSKSELTKDDINAYQYGLLSFNDK